MRSRAPQPNPQPFDIIPVSHAPAARGPPATSVTPELLGPGRRVYARSLRNGHWVRIDAAPTASRVELRFATRRRPTSRINSSSVVRARRSLIPTVEMCREKPATPASYRLDAKFAAERGVDGGAVAVLPRAESPV